MFTITPISLPPSQGTLGWFPPHLYFPKFHRPLQFSGPKEEYLVPETRFSVELLMSTTSAITVFWSSCASHTDLFLIYMLFFSGWLISSFTWNVVHTVRAVFVTARNDLHFLSYTCSILLLGEGVLNL